MHKGPAQEEGQSVGGRVEKVDQGVGPTLAADSLTADKQGHGL